MEKNITDKIITNIEKLDIGKEQILSVEKPVEIPNTPLSPRPKFEVQKPTGGGGGDGGDGPKIRVPHPSEFHERTVQQRIPYNPEFDVPAGYCGTKVEKINMSSIVSDSSIKCEFAGDATNSSSPWPSWLLLSEEGVITGTRPSKPCPAAQATYKIKYENTKEAFGTINVGEVTRQFHQPQFDITGGEPKNRL